MMRSNMDGVNNINSNNNNNNLDEYLRYVNQIKKTQGNMQFKYSFNDGVVRQNEQRVLAPSGPRRPGEGVEDEEQGIVFAEKSDQGSVYVYITLLAAGFVIGPKGRSIHQICHTSGADVRSWSTNFTAGSKQPPRALRVFQIQGDKDSILEAVKIMVTAVDRYKELSEGKYEGQVVDKEQTILGIEFHYQPPPKHAVPIAARIKSENYLDPIQAMYNQDMMSRGIPLQEQSAENFYNYMGRRGAEGIMRTQSLGAGRENMAYMRTARCMTPVGPPRAAVGYVQVQQGVPPVATPYYHYVQYNPNMPPAAPYGQATIYEAPQWNNSAPLPPASAPQQVQQVASHGQVQQTTYQSPMHVGVPLPQPNAGQISVAASEQYGGHRAMSNYGYPQNVVPPTPNPMLYRGHLGTFICPQMYAPTDPSLKTDSNRSPTGIEQDFTQV
eukprot:TRINITY_DN6383_c0_g2_i1.p1 TRINITY_DN6383_c0_g2~~TRINITY_DN6383_c0_g2_i1.p1  ORF type:complete len:440 (+),score=65.01 TRINITY_DN6383_c0_g2_i1:338-1657(+)